MRPEILKRITDRKITTQSVIREMEYGLNADTVRAISVLNLVQKATSDMISSRMMDVKIEEDQMRRETKFKLELFVFNKQELEDLIQSVHNFRDRFSETPS
jgi:hypothetical protein